MSDSTRQRVVPALRTRRLWAVALLAGLLYGAALSLALDKAAEWAASNWPVAGPIAVLHVLSLPWVLAGVVIGRRPVRAARLFGLAAVAILGTFLAAMAAGLINRPGFGADADTPLLSWRIVIALLVCWGAASLLLLLGRWIARRLFGVPFAQPDPPRYCWACAYERAQADPCPECGTSANAAAALPQREAAAWRWAMRGAVPALVCTAIAFTGYAAWRVRADFVPTRAFLSAFSEERGWSDSYAYIDHVHGADSRGLGGRYLNSIGVTRVLPDGSGRMILVSYRALVPGGLPVMQVRICAEATLPLGWPPLAQRMTDWGSPGTIVADLNREQAEHVVRHGLPQSLVGAIVAEADRVGWKPWGGMQSGGGRIEIDPAPHFADRSSAK